MYRSLLSGFGGRSIRIITFGAAGGGETFYTSIRLRYPTFYVSRFSFAKPQNPPGYSLSFQSIVARSPSIPVCTHTYTHTQPLLCKKERGAPRHSLSWDVALLTNGLEARMFPNAVRGRYRPSSRIEH